MHLRLFAQRGPEDALAGVPGTVVPPLWVDGGARQVSTQTQFAEYPRRVRTKLDAGPDLPERFRLLEQDCVNATLPQRERGCDAADAAPGDQDPEITCDQGSSRRAPCRSTDGSHLQNCYTFRARRDHDRDLG
jgi:hypothetical protein